MPFPFTCWFGPRGLASIVFAVIVLNEHLPDVNSSWLESDAVIQDEPAFIREWWTLFNNPVLTRLVHEVYEQNLSLRAAGLRVIQARAARGIAVGDFLAQEQAIRADYSNNQISKNDSNNPPLTNSGQRA